MTLAVFTQDGFSHFNFTKPGGAVFGRYAPGTGARYYLKDHLGSTRLVTDQNNGVIATFDYYPFGLLMPERYTVNNSTVEKFTGKELDNSLGLYYFGARYLDPAIARWFVVDPLAQKHPEWSPYNYVLNNPFFYVDPDGQQISAFELGMRAGIKQSVRGTWQGTKNLYMNPVQTMKAAGHALYNYKQTYTAFKAGVGKRWDMLASGNPYQVGQIAGEVLALGVGIAATKGAGALAKSGVRMLKGVDKLPKVAKGVFTFETRTFQHMFSRHAKDFGITSNWSKTTARTFEGALRTHIQGIEPIKGTYRGSQSALHYFNPKTKLNVMTDIQGNLIGGWKLSEDQIKNLLSSGNIQ